MSDGNEFAELLWENGQAVVHGRRKQPQTAFPPFTCGGSGSSRAQEKHPGSDPMALLKTGGLFGVGGMASSIHDFSSGLDATRGNGDLDDTVPWINYPIIDDDSAAPALADSYSPDFFSELQAAAAAATNLTSPPPSIHHTANNRSNPVATSSREPEVSKEGHRMSAPATRPEPQAESAAAKQPRSSGEGLMNFALFSRPAAMARASLQSAQRPPPQGTDKPSNVTVTASTRMESTVVQSSCGPRTAPAFTDQRTAWPQPKEVRFACTAAPTAAAGNLQQEMPRDRAGNNMTLQKKVETRMAPEVAVTSSSVCSGNGAGNGNDESWRHQKRKSQAECSASQDDDLEDDSGGLRRSASRGTKRSRTAEVHNLSERRRRDRINEKMRALQELIPNCNKIDKASMLDEAIEYLKTLQLQLQMMSMGSGLCIPPMLLPSTMQHLQIPPMAHFPHLGMGLGYGMGLFDMNNPGCSAAVPLAPMPGAHFPYSMIPGAVPQGLGMPGRDTVPMFGVPGQAIHSSASSVQPFPSLAGLPVRPNLAPQVSATMANMVQEQQKGVANQQQQNLNNEARQEANTGGPQLQTILQVENQHFSAHSSAQTESCQFLDGGGNRTNTTGRNGAET
ncbi:transcription factor PHYTOCHROME INTERACTING FACTOR-LIKE 15-like [Phragmites australis]|uniref:transcription factor PHYTOCHROME INTERACTING FACTOR-LIKE 15-like n=1 Tax=Phragmites australis TaxID=29695 RepID=UPI002D7959CA|nr:transcription factor PHYTOCHROME INTERACTING FACTOR-LIKE 15-like [Phragmites australis]XP_062208808.1 transcription factor PHYTOCHROME INTERACTING FACTOR-LIKE 15-like [Phragmites australis]